jgi:GntR family transcriptional repressor for pyruvate dehydrogenase complex
MAEHSQNSIRNPVSPDPTDYVIEQIHTMLREETISPGDRLPAEKKLEEKFELPRGIINKALKRLETYGIVRMVPQSGSYIADIQRETLESLIYNILNTKNNSYESLADVRQELEMYAVELVARNATDDDLAELELLQKKLELKIKSGQYSFEEDMVFHLKIAAFTNNIFLKSVLTSLSVDMINRLNAFSSAIGRDKMQIRLMQAISEHQQIIEALKRRDPEEAKRAMENHFESSKSFRKKTSTNP